MKKLVKAVAGSKHSVIYTDEDGKHFRFFEGTWAWRNHNPGNLRPKSKKHTKFRNQIGIVDNFVVFPADELGHDALVKDLKTNYMNDSIDQMIVHFAPPKENNTKRYAKILHDGTGVYDDRQLKEFTPIQFKKLWETIQRFEGYKVGKIIEVFQITVVCKNKKGAIDKLCLQNKKWITKTECIALAKQRKVDLEVCRSSLNHLYLRTDPYAEFQEKLENLVKK